MASAEQTWHAIYPFESHWLAAAGGRIHFLDEGSPSAAPMLFVHGNPTWSFHWRRFIQQFSPHRRCVAIDHLGCGMSDKPQRPIRLAEHIDNLVALIDELALERITLVAQDWGGAIGLGAMLARPAALDRIVLFNTGAFPPWYIPYRISICRTPLLGRLALQGANLFTRAALRMTLSRTSRPAPAVAQAYLAHCNNWQNRRQIYEFVADIPMSPNHPTWNTLHEIEQGLPSLANRPAQLIWGMKDWCFRPDCLEKFIGYWPQAEVHRLADAGHWVVEDAPDEALSLMDDFLATASPPQQAS